MKRFVVKAALVATCIASLAAFVAPAMASAATWKGWFIGAPKVLEAKNVELHVFELSYNDGWWCKNVKLNVKETNPSKPLSVTGATFENCTGHGVYLATGAATITAENLPGAIDAGLGPEKVTMNLGRLIQKSAAGYNFHYAGTQLNGIWSNVKHSLSYSYPSAEGMYIEGYPVRFFIVGEFVDPSQTLTFS